MALSFEHMYLLFAREEHFDVTAAGRTEQYDVATEAEAVEAAFVKQGRSPAEAGSAATEEQTRAAFEDFRASVRQHEFMLPGVSDGTMVARVRLEYPDEGLEECTPANVEQRIRQAYEGRLPGGKASSQWSTAEQWQRARHVTVRRAPAWGCTSYLPGGQTERVTVDLSDWSPGAPMRGIVDALNRFGGAGWSVIGCTEDKALSTHGAQSYEHPSRLRYLLSRPVTRSED